MIIKNERIIVLDKAAGQVAFPYTVKLLALWECFLLQEQSGPKGKL